MDIINLIKYCDTLTPVEFQLGQYILKHRVQVKKCSMESLCQKAFVSKSLVHRFCKKIGLSGFNDLKICLAEENKFGRNIDVNFPFLENDNHDIIAKKLVNLYEDTIKDTYNFIDMGELKKIVLLLYESEIIDIYTHAHNMSIAENFQDKMLSIGKFVTCTESFYKQRRQILLSDKTHVAVIMSYSGQATFIPKVISALSERNVPIIWIGRAGNHDMMHLSQYQLYISDREHFRFRLSQFSSHLAMQYTMDLLFSCIFKIDYVKNIEFIKNTIGFLDDRSINGNF